MPDHVPLHVHGSSKTYYDLGCRHKLCVDAASAAKKAYRARRRQERTWVDDHWEHPALKPVDSDSPRRHGTKYARETFQCECHHCKTRPDLVAFPGTSLLWAGHVNTHVAGVVLGVAAVVTMYHLTPTIDHLLASLKSHTERSFTL